MSSLSRYPARLAAAIVCASAVIAPVAVSGAEALEPRPQSAAGSTTWGIQPAAQDEPDGRVSLRYEIDPGAVITDGVAVTNHSAHEAVFAVYASDGTITADGSFDLVPADQPATGAGTWVELGPVDGATPGGGGLLLAVPAGETVRVPVTVRVPDNATPGDHPAGIVAQLAQQSAPGVDFASRVGVRVHLRVAGDLAPGLSPESIVTAYTPSWNPLAPGTLTVSYALTNVGNVRLGAGVETTAAGPFGIGGVATSLEHREILPGGEVPGTVELAVWPTFFTWGEVVATPAAVGEDRIDVPLIAGASAFGTWTIPWSQLVVLALVVAVIVLLRVRRRRMKAAIQARIDAAVAEATAAVVHGPGQTDAPADAKASPASRG